jgi:hypothetical protein
MSAVHRFIESKVLRQDSYRLDDFSEKQLWPEEFSCQQSIGLKPGGNIDIACCATE